MCHYLHGRIPLSRLELKQLQARGTGPVDLAVAAGECVCLSGASGSGKTVLLRAVADLDPHQGEAFLDARPAQRLCPEQWRRQVALLPAESQWWSDRVDDHFPRFDWERWARLGFGRETAKWQIARLSTGERQRLALLRLLANDPKVLLLDEPTASLDPENVERVEALVEEYRRASEAAVLWVSHDPAQIRRVADRHYRIEAGRLQEAPL